ncbi:glycerol kinase GlpK [Mangrovibacterium lignilyticum]|uniref:glycerol kinase GlpK n=1 Tax=Mangrovibacterium lignilyticum TaxID=2668052 RepID=UPI0019670632|nr:glycerol kinase GlpK [Mangrovibacterium lignilyticum]
MSMQGVYILAIDQSTSGTKAILFDRSGKLINRKTISHEQYYPQPGFVEHDPIEIYNNTCTAIHQVIAEKKVSEAQITGLSITNQRETALIWNKNTGEPVANAAVWQCQRGAEMCKQLKADGLEAKIRSKTGLVIDPYFSASKLSWIMNNTAGLKELAQQGELLLGTMDSWLLWKLTNGKVHATDHSNACRTMLFNIHTLDWDDELIELFGLNRNMFPEVRFSDEIYGYTTISNLFKKAKPIAGLIGDSHAALFGQNCFQSGMAKATYGTGSSIMMNVGLECLDAPEGLVSSIGYSCEKKVYYVYEGNIHCTGDTLNWLKNDVGLIQDASETESLATSVPNNNNVYLVPAFVGLGAPYWDNQARACLSGMGRNTTKAHIVRAALESIAFQVNDLISLMAKKGGIQLKELRVDGGPTRNKFLMQFQSDLLGQQVAPSKIEEASALGSAYMAGLAFGFWKDQKELENLRDESQTFNTTMNKDEVSALVKGWETAVKRARLTE